MAGREKHGREIIRRDAGCQRRECWRGCIAFLLQAGDGDEDDWGDVAADEVGSLGSDAEVIALAMTLAMAIAIRLAMAIVTALA